jgi:hypothetical protein
MLTERISKHLGVKYVYMPDKKMFLCETGVPFTLKEFKKGIDLEKEYEKRKSENTLYDYNYAKNTGLLRRKRGYAKHSENDKAATQEEQQGNEEVQADDSNKDISEWRTGKDVNALVQGEVSSSSRMDKRGEDKEGQSTDLSRRDNNTADKAEEKQRETDLARSELRYDNGRRAVGFIIALLAFTSLISGYISTLQTATYLYDYVDVISAWLMSSSVTAYNVTAFEVAVLFKQNRRYGLTFVFISLWVTVTVFSMATAVSVFYDRFNFNETVVAEDNKAIDSNKLSLELLHKKEVDLREAIAFKKQDIQYRQERDYATTAVRNELVKLEADLQDNLSQQQELLADTPEVTQEAIKKKERLFAFLGRMLHVDSGVFEFIMSTLSAIFVNLISPLSLVAVTELKKKKLDKPSIV